ncbi:MAG: hypothetical protein LQ347_004296 [Umbilicaria vellea]|nr:MAG: hypothetical protein LQ347_004296 [Umbilicaria vellea]
MLQIQEYLYGVWCIRNDWWGYIWLWGAATIGLGELWQTVLEQSRLSTYKHLQDLVTLYSHASYTAPPILPDVVPSSSHTLNLRFNATMISDDDLYRLAIFLGSLSMLLIVLYHFLEINAKDDGQPTATPAEKLGAKPATPGQVKMGAR